MSIFSEESNQAQGLSRRELIKRGLAVGISATAAGRLLLDGARSMAQEVAREVKEGPIVRLIREYQNRNQTPGVAVALYDANHQPAAQTFSEGYASLNSKKPVGPDLVFEIGSVTKVFTSTLLAYRPEIFDEPLAKHLPIEIRNPALDQIKVVNLATHTSGFPPDVEGLGRDGGPYLFHDKLPPEDSAVAKLWRTWKPKEPGNGYCRDCQVGTCWNYSNVGFVTLGFVVAGKEYNRLLREKITGPLSMSGTVANPSQGDALVDGYVFKDGKPQPTGKQDTDLKSTANDMINWIKAQVQPPEIQDSALGSAIARTHEKHFAGSDQCLKSHSIIFDMGLGWQMHPFRQTGLTIYIKDGGTFLGGQSCWVGFIESRKIGVAVLTNMIGGNSDPSALGRQILAQRLGVEG